MAKDLADRCDAIEECYEYCLAYAAQGHAGDGPNETGAQIRMFLTRALEAISGLADHCAEIVKGEKLEHAEKYGGFLGVIHRDAQDTQAIVELVLAQRVISSQLIDNLNASIHLRALLTDLFLIDELLKQQRLAADPAAAN